MAARAPLLIAVTGAPGSGKTAVARPLAEWLGLPLFAKDDVKEALWDYLGAGDRERFLAYGHASYPLLLGFARATLAAGRSVVVEANFTPEWAAGELEELRSETPFRFVQVLCRADPETSIYPLLSRLRKDELVTTFWQESESGPPRRYYRLTDAGTAALADFTSSEGCRARCSWAGAFGARRLFRPEFGESLGATLAARWARSSRRS